MTIEISVQPIKSQPTPTIMGLTMNQHMRLPRSFLLALLTACSGETPAEPTITFCYRFTPNVPRTLGDETKIFFGGFASRCPSIVQVNQDTRGTVLACEPTTNVLRNIAETASNLVESVNVDAQTAFARPFTQEELRSATLSQLLASTSVYDLGDRTTTRPFSQANVYLPGFVPGRQRLAYQMNCSGYARLSFEGRLGYSASAFSASATASWRTSDQAQASVVMIFGTMISQIYRELDGTDNDITPEAKRYRRLILWDRYRGGLDRDAVVFRTLEGAFFAEFSSSQTNRDLQTEVQLAGNAGFGDVRLAASLGRTNTSESLFETFRTIVLKPNRNDSVLRDPTIRSCLPQPSEIAATAISATPTLLQANPPSLLPVPMMPYARTWRVEAVPRSVCEYNDWQIEYATGTPDAARLFNPADATVRGVYTDPAGSCDFSVSGVVRAEYSFEMGRSVNLVIRTRHRLRDMTAEQNADCMPRRTVSTEDTGLAFNLRGSLQ